MTALTSHWRQLFDNKYLGAWNLWKGDGYTTTTVTIDRLSSELVTMQGGRKERALLAYFVGKKTPLIITKKMGKALARMHGPIPEGWRGKSITLYVEVGFKTADGPADVLRIKNAKAGQDLKDQLRDEPEPAEQFGDEGPANPDEGP